MKKGLVYTTVVGDYDLPKPVRVKEKGVRYVMLTDTGRAASGWDYAPALVSGNAEGMAHEANRALARQTKVMLPVFIEECFEPDTYDWFLWVDGTMEIVGPVRKFVEKALAKHDFAAWRHPWWQCSYIEVEKCKARKKDKLDNLVSGRDLLQREGFPKNYGQLATWVLLRKNTELVKQHAKAWWKDMTDTTMRDQVTFMLNLWRLKASIQWLPGTIDQAKWLKFIRGHKHGYR